MTVQLEQRIPRPRPPEPPAAVGLASVQGVLALDLSPRPDTGVDDARPRGCAAVAGDVEQLAHAFARALVEVLGGDRGPSQLLRWTTPRVYEELQERASVLHRTVPSDRRVRRLASQIRSVHLARPSPAAVELAIHVRRGQRSMAVAARLERRVQRHRDTARVAWLCTALEIG